MVRILFVCLLLLAFSCQESGPAISDIIKKDIMSVLNRQAEDWNRGDIESYMSGYWKSDSLRFASGGNVSYGWETTLQRYKKGYPDKNVMGHLTFTNIDIDVLNNRYALVFGKWLLQRKEDNPWGLFTLLFHNTPLFDVLM